MWTRREVLVAAAGLSAVGAMPACLQRSLPVRVDRAIARAIDRVWTLQEPAGGFISARSPELEMGQSTTVLVLRHLAAGGRPKWAIRESAGRRALVYALNLVGRDGALGMAGVGPDRPAAATAGAVVCLGLLAPEGWRARARIMLSYLSTAQPEDALAAATMLEAFRALELAPTASLVEYSTACRSEDGFGLSPGLSANGLATARLGVALRDARALDWLSRHHTTERVPGVLGGGLLRYLSSASASFADTGGPSGWANTLAEAVLAHQRPDGSFVGGSGVAEEDLSVATAMGIAALRHSRASVS